MSARPEVKFYKGQVFGDAGPYCASLTNLHLIPLRPRLDATTKMPEDSKLKELTPYLQLYKRHRCRDLTDSDINEALIYCWNLYNASPSYSLYLTLIEIIIFGSHLYHALDFKVKQLVNDMLELEIISARLSYIKADWKYINAYDPETFTQALMEYQKVDISGEKKEIVKYVTNMIKWCEKRI